MVNKVILVGNLGRDPELKHLPSGQGICQFSIATSESYTDKGGQKQEKTEWHRIVVWEKLAEVCARFLGKGSKVYVEGKLQTREYEKDGQKHYQTEIVAREVKFLSEKKAGAPAAAAAPDDEPF